MHDLFSQAELERIYNSHPGLGDGSTRLAPVAPTERPSTPWRQRFRSWLGGPRKVT